MRRTGYSVVVKRRGHRRRGRGRGRVRKEREKGRGKRKEERPVKLSLRI
jgi:hypothetical protein